MENIFQIKWILFVAGQNVCRLSSSGAWVRQVLTVEPGAQSQLLQHWDPSTPGDRVAGSLYWTSEVGLVTNTSWEQSSQFTDCFRRWLKLRRVLVEMTNTNNLQIHRMNPNFYMFGPVWTIYIYSPHFFFPNIKNHQRGNFHEEFYSQQYLHNLYEN